MFDHCNTLHDYIDKLLVDRIINGRNDNYIMLSKALAIRMELADHINSTKGTHIVLYLLHFFILKLGMNKLMHDSHKLIKYLKLSKIGSWKK